MEEKINIWLARDEDKSLWAYTEEPVKEDCQWVLPCKVIFDKEYEIDIDDDNIIKLNPNLFPNIKWEDEKPTKAKITLY